jgi:hypothetical protein
MIKIFIKEINKVHIQIQEIIIPIKIIKTKVNSKKVAK